MNVTTAKIAKFLELDFHNKYRQHSARFQKSTTSSLSLHPKVHGREWCPMGLQPSYKCRQYFRVFKRLDVICIVLKARNDRFRLLLTGMDWLCLPCHEWQPGLERFLVKYENPEEQGFSPTNKQSWARDNNKASRQRQRDNLIELQGPNKIRKIFRI